MLLRMRDTVASLTPMIPAISLAVFFGLPYFPVKYSKTSFSLESSS